MARKNKPQQAKAAPTGARAQRFIYIAIALLALVGVAETVYLTALHLAGAHVACIASANCSRVLGSSYAEIKGFPLAALGAVAYFGVFSFSTLSLFGFRRASTFLGLTIGGMFLATLYLLYLQAFVLRTFCDYCLFSAALVFLLAGLVIASPPQRRA
jgi:uncharacterized membrane protein